MESDIPLAGMESIRLLIDGGLSGALNMARDEAIALCPQGRAIPTIRFYSFSPPAITLGRFQKANLEEIDFNACERLGIDLIRRPTGGLALLHADDFTYSVIFPLEKPSLRVRDTMFHLISVCVIEGLRLLGVSARVAKRGKKKESQDAWCFLGEYGVDISVGERKICGSAQRIYRQSILQHGTLILAENKRFYSEILPLSSKSGNALPLSLEEEISKRVSWAEAVEAFKEGFSKGLGLSLWEGTLTPAEEKLSFLLSRKNRSNGFIGGLQPRV
ncbi:MAG: biotin/lipoate A/B protein ligase family protein [Actinomycetota bacterium]|nr:biotin/lipoate A/B protein ligase family protein [Actinomycetota bacterium]